MQNLVPRRVQYIIHAEKHSLKAADISSGTPCRIVKSPADIKSELDVCVQPDIDMYGSAESNDDLRSKHFGNVQVGHTYDYNGLVGSPLSQSGGPRSKYLVIDCVPTIECRDSEYYVNQLSDKFFGEV